MSPVHPHPCGDAAKRLSTVLSAPATVLCAVLIVLGGCGFDPVREVAPDTETPPADLAFVAQDETTESAGVGNVADGELAISQAPKPAETLTAGRWRQSLPASSIGVHSGPATTYTKLGEYEPDDLVLATGQRVDVEGVTWMQISWGETTAWVYEFAFTRTTA